MLECSLKPALGGLALLNDICTPRTTRKAAWMLGLGRLCWVGRSGSTQWNNPTNLTDPTGFVGADPNGNSSGNPSAPSPSNDPSKDEPRIIPTTCTVGIPCIVTFTDGKKGVILITTGNEQGTSGTKENQGKGLRKASNKENIHAETAATIGNAIKIAFANLIPDARNGAVSWVEEFFHTEPGILGRMDPWADARNEVAQEAAGDIRKVANVALMFTPLKGAALEAEAAKGGIGPVLKGEAGVARSIAAAEARGETVLGREITIQTAGGRTRLDILVRDAQGNLIFIESKCGPSACLNRNQTKRFPELEKSGGIPRGNNAAAAGLKPGQPIGPIRVKVDYWP